VLKVDAMVMLRSTNKEMKTLLHNLNKVVQIGEDYLTQLHENTPLDVEVLDGGGITNNIKVELKGRNPPCTLHFSYLLSNQRGNKGLLSEGKGDLSVFISTACKDPSEANNQGKYINVRD